MRDTIPCGRMRLLPMFRGVDDVVISSLLKCTSARLKRYGRQETVFVAQSEVRHVFVVASGSLKISEYGAKGEAHILRVCRSGHIVGLAHILGHLEVFTGSCIATEESEVLVMDWTSTASTGSWRRSGTGRLAKTSSG